MWAIIRIFIGTLALLAYCGAASVSGPFLAWQREAPYPAAGFRPSIAFELPTEVQTQAPVAAVVDIPTFVTWNQPAEVPIQTTAMPTQPPKMQVQPTVPPTQTAPLPTQPQKTQVQPTMLTTQSTPLPTQQPAVPTQPPKVPIKQTVVPTQLLTVPSQTPKVIYLPALTEVQPASTYGPPVETVAEEAAYSAEDTIEDIDPVAADAEEDAPIAPKALAPPAFVAVVPKAAAAEPAAVEHDENEDIIPDAFKPPKQNSRLRRPSARIVPKAAIRSAAVRLPANQPAAVEFDRHVEVFQSMPPSARLRFGTRLKPRQLDKLI